MTTSTTQSRLRERYAPAMRRALALSLNGPSWGRNPQVGCVLLDSDGQVVAEGWHRGSGTDHAEVDALSKLAPGRSAGLTAVVTLEPCNHTGRTGPCSQALIRAGVSRVVYAVADPGEESSGGAHALEAAGIEVLAGVAVEQVAESIHPWLESTRLGRPFVTVKWAASLDGRAAASDGSSQWITGPQSRADVHARRERADAIVVGTGTALADDPSLTARDEGGALTEHQPIPVVIGTRPLPADAAVHRHPLPPLFYADHDVAVVLADLFRRGIRTVLVEGGPTLASAFVAAGLADEFLLYQAPVLLGGPRVALADIGVPTLDDAVRLRLHDVRRLGDDVLLIARPKGL